MRQGVLFFICISLLACTDTPDFDVVPALTFDGVFNNTFAQSRAIDTAIIALTITDADGDIGESPLGLPTVFIVDEKDGFTQTFRLPRISEQGTGKGIKAEAQILYIINKGGLCCRYPDGTGGCIPSTEYPIDSFFYDTYVIDHAGNESNHVRVGPIYLICDDPN
jgi:hypothetical protein